MVEIVKKLKSIQTDDKTFRIFAMIAILGIAIMISALIGRFIGVTPTINFVGIIGLILFIVGLAALYVLIAVDSIEYHRLKKGA